MAKRISVVVSQSQSASPLKRKIEEDIVAELLMARGIDVTVVPHLYDLKPDGTGLLCLQGISGDMVFCSWLYPRAAYWVLDRNGIRGHEGVSLLKPLGSDDEDDDEAAADEAAEAANAKPTVPRGDLPPRKIYCLDLRAHDSAAPYLEEIHRIAKEATTTTVSLGSLESWPVRKAPASTASAPENTAETSASASTLVPGGPIKLETSAADLNAPQPLIVAEEVGRRWYPVIDYSRCTNCLECIDFCLFGVYGIDRVDTILVEQPDNCRKGCPACSRVCPENAIIFPQHKTPTIAGSPEVASGGGLKIDLSLLFGAPDPGAPGAPDAVTIAARERDEQLMLAGRDAVGMNVGIPKRQTDKPTAPKDELDALIDQLDDLEL